MGTKCKSQKVMPEITQANSVTFLLPHLWHSETLMWVK